MADQKKRIIELEELTTLTDNDYIAVDNSASGGETKKFKPKNLQDATNQVLEDVAYLTWEEDYYYGRGDIVAYDGYIYVCKVDEATYGSFVSSEWKKTFVERWARDLFYNMSMKEMTFSDSEYTMPYSKGDVVYRYYPHPSNDGFQMRFYVAKDDYPNGVTEYVASQWDEYLSLSEVVDALNKETNKSVDEALALGTASGSIASFTDGSTLPMKKLEVDIEPVQDLHGYDNPWVGGAGKNKLDFTDTTVTSSRTIASDISLKAGDYIVAFDIKNNSNIEGYYQVRIGTTGIGGVNFGANYSGRLSKTFTLSEDSVINIFVAGASSGYSFEFSKGQIELGSTATTFAPYSNICPISGWDECKVSVASKNLSKSQTNNSVLCSAKKGVTYTLSFEGNTGANIKKNTNSGEVVIWGPQLPLTFTADEDFNIFLNAWNANISNIQVEVGNQATAYEPYNGQTYTIDLDGTRYGGKLDVVSGVLTVDRWFATFEWGTIVTVLGDYERRIYNLSVSNVYPPTEEVPQICNVAPYIAGYSSDKLHFYCNGNQAIVFLPKGTPSTTQIEVSGELATPQTIQLTPTEVKTLLATNNIFADTGDILDATYVRNANITINDLIRRIENLEG